MNHTPRCRRRSNFASDENVVCFAWTFGQIENNSATRARDPQVLQHVPASSISLSQLLIYRAHRRCFIWCEISNNMCFWLPIRWISEPLALGGADRKWEWGQPRWWMLSRGPPINHNRRFVFCCTRPIWLGWCAAISDYHRSAQNTHTHI